MSRIFSVLSVACFCLAGFVTTMSAEDVQDQIKKIETDRATAVLKADVAALDKQTSDDYSIITMNGQMSNKSQMIDAFKSGQSKLSSDELSDMKVRVYGNTAVVTGKAEVKGMLGGQDATGTMMFTRVYVKKDGRWQSVAFQQTRVANP
ncbi:MAG: nuclear transport factor 2 family protein [Acidobacteriaceae bacterium]